MLFMIIEQFRDGNAEAVYQRYQEQGRMLPDGLEYVDSWVDTTLDRCFQLMESSDQSLVEEWTRRWDDLVEFEVVPVIKSSEAAAKTGRRD